MSTLSVGHLSSNLFPGQREASPTIRTGWPSTATGSASSGAAILRSSSPRILSSAANDLHNILSDTHAAMDGNRGMFNQRRSATELPPFGLSNSSGYQQQQQQAQQHPQQHQQQHPQQQQQTSYLPSPSHNSPTSTLPPHGYPHPSPSHHQTPVSMGSSTPSYHLASSGTQYPPVQHHQNQHATQQAQHQLPSPTQHSPQAGSIGSASEYSQHGAQPTPNYSLSSSSYPMMAHAGPYRPPAGFYNHAMPMQGGPIGTMHHPQGPMGMMGHPHGMPHVHGHYMYGPQPGQQHLDRPFKCDQCTQSFSRNHDLKRHKRIHLAVKPFPCNYCSKQFSRKDALKRHRLVKGCEEKARAAEKKAETQRNGGDVADNSPRETASESGSNDGAAMVPKSEHLESPQDTAAQLPTQLGGQAPPQINSQMGGQVQSSLLNSQLGSGQMPLPFHGQANGQVQDQGGLDHQSH